MKHQSNRRRLLSLLLISVAATFYGAQAAPVNTFDNGVNRGQQPLANAPAQGTATGNNTAPSQGQPQPTLANPQVRAAPRQPWGAAAQPATRTATPPQYGAGQLR